MADHVLRLVPVRNVRAALFTLFAMSLPDRATLPPGPKRDQTASGRKDDFAQEVRSAFGKMETPLFITLSGNRAIDLAGWLDLVEEAANSVKGLSLRVDAFAQRRDRSVHLAVYGLPTHREAGFVEALSGLARKVRAKKKFFLRVGGSLAYLWAHSEYSTRTIST